MEKVIYDEKNGSWYELQGDYYIPCLKLHEEEQQPIGIFGGTTTFAVYQAKSQGLLSQSADKR